MKKKKLKVLISSAEVAPFVKIGGLADVASSLPPALKKMGVDVRVILPKYKFIDEKKYRLKKIFENIEVLSDEKHEKINIWKSVLPNTKVPVYFIESKKYFSGEEVYDKDNSKKFLFFSSAVLYSLPMLKFKPDVIHAHDSHTAMITNLLVSSDNLYFKDIKTLFTIHNLNFQGKSDLSVLSIGNLNTESTKSLKYDSKDGDINFMVQGIVNANLVNTVSPTYAKEITSNINSAGLERVTKKYKSKISGIVNGLDVDFFNPSKDKYIKKQFSVKNLKGKIDNKVFLQKKLGLPVNKDVPIIGLISRLYYQKGLELITEKMISELDAQFVFLGTGEKKYEDKLKKLAKKHPKKVSANILFNISLAQQIYAGSDIFLMPSRYEPCGLGQMMAMRYGTVPVVRATGGLIDTVNTNLGFKFKNFTAKDLSKTLKKATNLYYNNRVRWNGLVRNCMNKDFSWEKSAKDYIRLYNKIMKQK